MSLKYWLSKSRLTQSPDNRIAVTQSLGTRTVEDVIDRMIHQGSTITKAEALATIEEFNQSVLEMIQQGYTVKTPLFSITLSITGVFTNDTDTFDARRHEVKARFRAGTLLRDMVKTILVKKIQAVKRKPVVSCFYDSSSKTLNKLLTPAGPATITGKLLKINMADENQGIFFINTASGKTTRMSTTLLRNMPGELIFCVPPDLVPGPYQVEVRAVIPQIKTSSSGILSHTLLVP